MEDIIPIIVSTADIVPNLPVKKAATAYPILKNNISSEKLKKLFSPLKAFTIKEITVLDEQQPAKKLYNLSQSLSKNPKIPENILYTYDWGNEVFLLRYLSINKLIPLCL